MFSIIKQVIQTKNDWGLKPLIVGAVYELLFLIKHPRFKYFFVVEPENLDISSEDKELTDPYVPAPYYILINCLTQITKMIGNPRETVFIDIGCGPGRALYMSSTMGFDRLIGIELSRNLAELCNMNLKKYLSPEVDARIVNENVKDISFPELVDGFDKARETKTLVFFLYDPFCDEVLRAFMDKLDDLYAFDCFIIYFGPQNDGIIMAKHFSIDYLHYENPDTPIKIYARKKSTKQQPEEVSS